MSDFGAKGTAPGFDVNSAIDYLQQFNSSWPLLKIGDDSTASGTVTHNLGYPPFHIITTAEGQVDQYAGVVTSNFGVDSSVLARTSGSGSFKYFICRLDLTTNYTAGSIPGTIGSASASPNFGFKVTKPTKATTSTDMRDYALHSSTRSLMVHMVNNGLMANTGGGLGLERTVTHGLGYKPEAFAFILPGTNILSLDTGRYSMIAPSTGVAAIYYSVNATTVYITADPFYFSTLPRISTVVLKDPLAQTTVNVSFP